MKTDDVKVASHDLVKTDTTGETYIIVSNADFLNAVHDKTLTDINTNSRPLIVSFKGNPTSVPPSAWVGKPLSAEFDVSVDLPANANNYFSLSTFQPNKAGQYRRQKANYAAMCGVILDDVGTKVAIEKLTLPPSYLLETSPGNYQAAYLFYEPLVDGIAADQLMGAIILAGLSDPGMNGPRTRLARLPVATNGKHTPPFPCRMKKWSPELRYTQAELVVGFKLSMAPGAPPPRQSARVAQQRHIHGDQVLIPRPNENSVLVALRARGLYKASLGEGKHDITCPWVQEHTGAVNGGTAYFEPNDKWPIGGFKCFHGHCAERRVRDLLQYVCIEVSAARMKSTIRIIAGDIHLVVDAAERELAQTLRHYQRGGMIVNVVTDPGTGETRVQDISQPALVRALAEASTWEQINARSNDWIRVDPPARHAAVLFDSNSYHHLPVLNGLARQPYLRQDGSLMMAPGYDAVTAMFGVFDPSEFSIPNTPTREDAQAALKLLNDMMTEFSFARDADLAAALTAMLTAAVRPSLKHAPMFHAKAPMAGSGKSYLCELITAMATPQRGTPTTFPGDDEECRKLLLAELLRSPAVIEFDNLTGDLVAHKSLCTALTSEHMSGRILGVSKTANVNTRALFLSSGNNVGPVQDMARRCITINLDPGCEVPAARTFTRPDLVSDVLRQRGRYVSAALTIVRAWIIAGRPKTECKSLAGFGDWSDMCRQPLLWLGLADPTESLFIAMAEDPDREILGRILAAWQGVFGKKAAMVRDAVNNQTLFSDENTELNEVIHDIADERGTINRRKLGWWIKRHAGRIVDGRRFVRGSGKRSAETWQVEITSSAAVS